MRISLVRHEGDNEPQVWECAWEELATLLTCHVRTAEKQGQAAFCPAVFRGKRRKENVVELGAIVLDFDGLTWEQAADALTRLESYRRIVYSSYSHGLPGKGVRFRVVLCPDRPILAKEWPGVWGAVYARLAPLVDAKSCRDAAHLYYVATCPPESEPFAEAADGALICVDDFVGFGAPEARDGTVPITLPQLERIASGWQRRSSLTDSFLGAILAQVCRGEPYASAGERDDITWRLCARLAKEIPEVQALSLAQLFEASLSLMGEDAPSVAKVAEKFSRARNDLDAAPKAAEDWRQERIRSAFRGTRETPYSPAEIQAWGVRADEWVLSCGRTEIWLAFDGSYVGPWIRANEECLAYLSPAPFPVVRVTQEGGLTWRSMREVLAAHGKTITRKIVHLGGRGRAHYDRSTDTLHTYSCPLRDLPAVYDADVATWLARMGGERAKELVTWLSAAPDPEVTLPMLWLIGPSGAGKSLLAHGLNRLWSPTGAGSAHEAVGSGYNAELLRSPLLLSDESLPRDWRGNVPTDKLRTLITADTHSVNEKYGQKAEAQGKVRLIATANSVDSLTEGTTAADIEALAARILHVPVQRTDIDAELAHAFVHDDRIASHVLWLASQRLNGKKQRFAVAGSPEIAEKLFLKAGWRPQILTWICLYLQDPHKHALQRVHPAVIVDGDGLAVNANELVCAWGDYYGERLNARQSGQVRATLQELYQKGGSGQRVSFRGAKYRRLEKQFIEKWYFENFDEKPDYSLAIFATNAKNNLAN